METYCRSTVYVYENRIDVYKFCRQLRSAIAECISIGVMLTLMIFTSLLLTKGVLWRSMFYQINIVTYTRETSQEQLANAH
jgi:hypothetical protein